MSFNLISSDDYTFQFVDLQEISNAFNRASPTDINQRISNNLNHSIVPRALHYDSTPLRVAADDNNKLYVVYSNRELCVWDLNGWQIEKKLNLDFIPDWMHYDNGVLIMRKDDLIYGYDFENQENKRIEVQIFRVNLKKAYKDYHDSRHEEIDPLSITIFKGRIIYLKGEKWNSRYFIGETNNLYNEIIDIDYNAKNQRVTKLTGLGWRQINGKKLVNRRLCIITPNNPLNNFVTYNLESRQLEIASSPAEKKDVYLFQSHVSSTRDIYTYRSSDPLTGMPTGYSTQSTVPNGYSNSLSTFDETTGTIKSFTFDVSDEIHMDIDKIERFGKYFFTSGVRKLNDASSITDLIIKPLLGMRTMHPTTIWELKGESLKKVRDVDYENRCTLINGMYVYFFSDRLEILDHRTSFPLEGKPSCSVM